MSVITLQKPKFEEFYKILSLISGDCMDVSIKSGIIRQITDDRKITYHINLGIPDLTLNISVVKNLLPILKALMPENDDETVTIEISDRVFYISDNESKVSVQNVDDKSLFASFIEDDKFQLYNGDILTSFTLTQRNLNKLVSIGKTFVAEAVVLEVKDKNCKIKLETPSHTTNATITTVKVENLDDGTYVVPYSIFTFPFTNPQIELIQSEKLGRKFLKIKENNIELYGSVKQI